MNLDDIIKGLSVLAAIILAIFMLFKDASSFFTPEVRTQVNELKTAIEQGIDDPSSMDVSEEEADDLKEITKMFSESE